MPHQFVQAALKPGPVVPMGIMGLSGVRNGGNKAGFIVLIRRWRSWVPI